ncbi:unnamed protein product, partial [Allacma fusca]
LLTSMRQNVLNKKKSNAKLIFGNPEYCYTDYGQHLCLPFLENSSIGAFEQRTGNSCVKKTLIS